MKSIIDRKFIYLAFAFVLATFLINDGKIVFDFLTFDLDAPDLKGLDKTPIELRNMFYSSSYQYGVISSIVARGNQVLLTIFFSIIMIIYANYKNRYLIFSIGKVSNYSRELVKTKLKIIAFFCILVTIVNLIYIVVSYYITEFKIDLGNGFSESLYHLIPSNIGIVILYIIEINLFIITLAFLLFKVIDLGYAPIKASIWFLVITFVLSGLIDTFISPKYSLLASIGFLNIGKLNHLTFIISYIYMLIIYFCVVAISGKNTDRKK